MNSRVALGPIEVLLLAWSAYSSSIDYTAARAMYMYTTEKSLSASQANPGFRPNALSALKDHESG